MVMSVIVIVVNPISDDECDTICDECGGGAGMVMVVSVVVSAMVVSVFVNVVGAVGAQHALPAGGGTSQEADNDIRTTIRHPLVARVAQIH